jgi:hypothetical protein
MDDFIFGLLITFLVIEGLRNLIIFNQCWTVKRFIRFVVFEIGTFILAFLFYGLAVTNKSDPIIILLGLFVLIVWRLKASLYIFKGYLTT